MAASTTVKVGLTQMACGEDPKKNLAKQLALLERALKKGAKIEVIKPADLERLQKEAATS